MPGKSFNSDWLFRSERIAAGREAAAA